MRVLLDTHTLLWWLNGDAELTPAERAAIESSQNTAYVSVVSVWEIVIKHAAGKLGLPPELPAAVNRPPLRVLPILTAHALAVGDLPLLHRDPFDRLLVAQARVEQLTLLTRDPDIKRYDVPIFLR